MLVDEAGTVVGRAAAPTPFSAGEMPAEHLRGCLAGVLGRLEAGARRAAAAVGFAGVAESGAPLDGRGRALAPIIAWHDPRGQEAVDALEGALGPQLAQRIGQPVRPVLTAAKLGWLVAQGMPAPARWLGVPELGLHALTGAEVTEFSLAARTGCYDVAARGWIPEVGEVLGFPVGVFAPVCAAGEVMGRISPAGAAWSGLPTGIPVTVAGHDHLVGMAGAGVAREQAGNSVGTAETLLRRCPALPDRVAARQGRIAVTVHPGGTAWVALASAARAGIVLETAAAALGSTPPELDRRAGRAEPVPLDATAIDRLAHGQPVELPRADAGAVWAGVLDALAARTADACARLGGLLGRAEGVVVFGGGSVSEPWRRAKAARIGLPVHAAGGGSAVARGAALYAGAAAGLCASPPGAAG